MTVDIANWESEIDTTVLTVVVLDKMLPIPPGAKAFQCHKIDQQLPPDEII